MNCRELQEVMSQSIDGGLGSKIRKEVALHLAGCEDCLNLINGDKFWDDAVISLLHREAPADLRSDILGDLADNPELKELGWQKNLKLIAWGARRNNMTVRDWVLMIAIFGILYWLVPLLVK